MITFTPAALSQIAKSLKTRGHGIGIRIGVKQSGCTGYAYTLEYVDELAGRMVDMTVIPHDGFVLIVNNAHKPLLDGMVVDFVRVGLNSGFEFINPQETARCGCGSSVKF